MKRAILLLIAATFLALGQAAFALDTCLPTLTMTPTALPAYVQANPSVSGTASDATTGISAVRGAIFYFDESGQAYFWDGSSSWVTSDYLTFAVPTTGSLNTPGAIVSWSYTFPTLTNSRTYYYYFWAKDQANNLSAGQTRSTVCDSSNPVLGSQFPPTSTDNYTRFGAGKFYINGIFWSDLCIKGIAIDPSGSGQIDRITLTISETGGKYYNGDTDSWQSTSCSFEALRGSATDLGYYFPLSYIAFSAALDNNDVVTIVAKAYDKAGNYTTSTQTLKIDTVSPTITISNQSNMTSYPILISGEANDSNGVETVLLSIRRTRGATNTYWDGTTWQATAPTPSKITGLTQSGSSQIWWLATTHLFKGCLAGDTYLITATAVDRAGKSSTSATKTLQHHPTEMFIGVTCPPLAYNASGLTSSVTAEIYDPAGYLYANVYFGVSRYVPPVGAWAWYKWVPKTWAAWGPPISDFAINPTSSSGNTNILSLAGHLDQINYYPANPLQNGDLVAFVVSATNTALVTKTVTYLTIYDTAVPINPTPTYTGVRWYKEPILKLLKTTDFNPASDPAPASSGRLASGIAAFNTRTVFNTATITTETIYSSGPESFTVNMNQGPGVYSLYINTRDQADNSPATESCLQVGYDNLSPLSGSVTYPSPWGTIDNTIPTITWTAASDEHSGLLGYYILIDGRVIGGTAAGITSFTVPYDQRIVNGTHSLIIRAIDAVGNYSDAITTFTVNTNIPPQVSITSPVNNSYPNSTNVTLQGLVADDCLITKVEMSLNGGAFTTIFSGSLPKVGIYQTVTLIPNAPNTIGIRATDDSGITTEASVVVTPDVQAPDAFSPVTPANDSYVPNLPSLTWEQSTDSVSGLKGYDLYLDSVKVNSTPLTNVSYSPETPLADGSHDFYVVAWDQAGNYFQTETFTFNVDSASPSTPTILTPLEGQTFTSAFNVAWQTSLDPDAGLSKYEVYWNDALIKETTSTSFWMTAVPTDGSYSLKVIAYDLIGNQAASPTVNIKINVNAPAIALYVNDKSIANNAQINTLPKIKAEIQDASGIDPSSILIYIDDQLQSGLSLQAVNSQSTLVTAYNVTKNDVRLAAGTHKLKIVAKDIHGKSTSRELIGLKVSGKAEITGFVMNYPNPFKPLAGTGTTINYTLADDANLKIMIYDLSGRLINKIDCLEGTEGGRFGENNVPWDGKTFVGDALANGAYIYLIVDSKNNVIGSGEMAVYE